MIRQRHNAATTPISDSAGRDFGRRGFYRMCIQTFSLFCCDSASFFPCAPIVFIVRMHLCHLLCSVAIWFGDNALLGVFFFVQSLKLQFNTDMKCLCDSRFFSCAHIVWSTQNNPHQIMALEWILIWKGEKIALIFLWQDNSKWARETAKRRETANQTSWRMIAKTMIAGLQMITHHGSRWFYHPL